MSLMYLLLFVLGSVWYSSATDKLTLELIPFDLLCPFCIALIRQFQQITEQNPAFKEVLCESLSNKSVDYYNLCIKSFTEMTVEKLKTFTAEELCHKQRLCSAHQRKVILMANNGKPDFPDIPFITDEQREDARRKDILKNIGDAFNGKLEDSNGKNLTLFINLRFQPPHEATISINSTEADDNGLSETHM